MTAAALKSDTRSLVDGAQLTPRYFGVLAILSAALAFEMFDFVIVSFLLSAVAPMWKLTFGQSATILLVAGVGAMIGSAIAGPVADRYGRRGILLVGITLCPLAAAAIGTIPEGDWVGFAILRFVLGIGYGMAGVAQFALIVELTPARYRTMLASATMIPVSIGFIMAPAAMSLFYGVLGWRGLALIGATPILFALLIYLFVPESPGWLVRHGRIDAAMAAMRTLFGTDAATPERPQPTPAAGGRPPLGTLRDHPRPLAFAILAYGLNATGIAGVLMWGPVFVGMLLGLSPQQVAGYFVVIGVSGLIGRVVFTLLSPRIGRRRAGQIHSFAAALFLALGTLLPDVQIAGLPLFLVALTASAFFFDGGLANLQPHAAEIFPVDVAGRGMAASQVAVGIGKITGPLVLAVLAGTGNIIMPAATRAAIVPGFLAMAAMFVLTGLAFTFLGIDTGRRPARG